MKSKDSCKRSLSRVTYIVEQGSPASVFGLEAILTPTLHLIGMARTVEGHSAAASVAADVYTARWMLLSPSAPLPSDHGHQPPTRRA